MASSSGVVHHCELIREQRVQATFAFFFISLTLRKHASFREPPAPLLLFIILHSLQVRPVRVRAVRRGGGEGWNRQKTE